LSQKSKEENKTIFRLGELFCGPGGLALGAKRARVKNGDHTYLIDHAWAVDYEQDSCDTYRSNICPDKPESVLCQDVRSLDIASLPAIDAFAYGFPCNDFSIVGERNGFHGNFGPLYRFGVDVLNTFKPKFFVAENVGGLTSSNEGRSFKKILEDLENAGNKYDLSVHYYKLEEYGVPQARHRYIIVGIDKKLGVRYSPPKPSTLFNPITAKEALEIPPIPENAPNQELTKQSKTVIERLKHTKPWENAWTANLPTHLRLNVKGAKLSQIYRRLHPDKPSYTITGSGGGGTHGYHWREPRALTNRERARLQTFPDNYKFKGSKESVRKQLGMAVPPKMSQIIFESILKTLIGKPYPSIQENMRPTNQMELFHLQKSELANEAN
jgi:DNA (cytosine-5)-methyltransferase 1